jgi:cytochrome P450
MTLLLLVAATATTSCGIGNLIQHMQLHADASRTLTGPDKVKAFVLESLRIEPPAHRTARFCARDLEIRGVQLARRTPVELSMGSASRDPERFPDPDRFDPSRRGAVPPVFGYGVHACLGRSLALLELESVCEVLSARYELEPVGPSTGTCGKGLRRPVSLMMCLHPRTSR